MAFHLGSALSNPARIDITTVLPVTQKTALDVACRIDDGCRLRLELPDLIQGGFPLNPHGWHLADSRPSDDLPPLAVASPEQLATAFFCLPPGHIWQYPKRNQDNGPKNYVRMSCQRAPARIADDTSLQN